MMIGWHHQLDGHEFEQVPGVGDGQGSQACCSPWVTKSQTGLSDWTDWIQSKVDYPPNYLIVGVFFLSSSKLRCWHCQFLTSEELTTCECWAHTWNLGQGIWAWLLSWVVWEDHQWQDHLQQQKKDRRLWACVHISPGQMEQLTHSSSHACWWWDCLSDTHNVWNPYLCDMPS